MFFKDFVGHHVLIEHKRFEDWEIRRIGYLETAEVNQYGVLFVFSDGPLFISHGSQFTVDVFTEEDECQCEECEVSCGGSPWGELTLEEDGYEDSLECNPDDCKDCCDCIGDCEYCCVGTSFADWCTRNDIQYRGRVDPTPKNICKIVCDNIMKNGEVKVTIREYALDK